MTEGIISDIQRFSVNDGPGIRTAVFFKGCPLRCVWCHNPETQSSVPELWFNPNLCRNCRECEKVCARNALQDRGACSACFECAKVCSYGARKTVGEKITEDELLSRIMRDKKYYDKSGGGVTFSGGEPLLQPEFLLDVIKRLSENGVDSCIETSGFARPEDVYKAGMAARVIYFDIKESESERLLEYTGADIRVIEENLRILEGTDAEVVLTCPVIPGINDRESHYSYIARAASGNGKVTGVRVLPYHREGSDKLAYIGRENPIPGKEALDKNTAGHIAEYISALSGKPAVVG